jgi:ribosomal protein L7Ae-like RNA K-turn-binding protein
MIYMISLNPFALVTTMSEYSDKTEKVLSLLGIARRAGRLIIGQDNVQESMRSDNILAITANDCSGNVMRFLRNGINNRGLNLITLNETGRDVLGMRVGVKSAQVVALPFDDGFAVKIYSVMNGSAANE